MHPGAASPSDRSACGLERIPIRFNRIGALAFCFVAFSSTNRCQLRRKIILEYRFNRGCESIEVSPNLPVLPVKKFRCIICAPRMSNAKSQMVRSSVRCIKDNALRAPWARLAGAFPGGTSLFVASRAHVAAIPAVQAGAMAA